METDVDKAERLGRARAILFYLMAAAFLVSGVIGLQAQDSLAQLMAWLLLAFLNAVNLLPFAGARLGRLKRLLNDETTRTHRQRSFVIGFWISIASAAVLSVVARFQPIGAEDMARTIVTVSLSAALVSFATLELKAAQ